VVIRTRGGLASQTTIGGVSLVHSLTSMYLHFSCGVIRALGELASRTITTSIRGAFSKFCWDNLWIRRFANLSCVYFSVISPTCSSQRDQAIATRGYMVPTVTLRFLHWASTPSGMRWRGTSCAAPTLPTSGCRSESRSTLFAFSRNYSAFSSQRSCESFFMRNCALCLLFNSFALFRRMALL